MKNNNSFFSMVAILVAMSLLFTSCATLFGGGASQNVSFSSEPGGTKVFVNGTPMGTTPCELKLEKKKTYTVEFRKDGYQSYIFNISNSVGAGWIILDILGGLIPIIVDAATGSWYSLDQEHINAMLEKQQVGK